MILGKQPAVSVFEYLVHLSNIHQYILYVDLQNIIWFVLWVLICGPLTRVLTHETHQWKYISGLGDINWSYPWKSLPPDDRNLPSIKKPEVSYRCFSRDSDALQQKALRPSIHTAKTWHSRSKTQLTPRRYQNLSIAPTDMSYAILAYTVVDGLWTFYNAVRGRQHTFDTSQTRRKDDHRRKSNNPCPETGNTANTL